MSKLLRSFILCGIGILLFTFAVIVIPSNPVGYEHQVDARYRQYHPVTIVDKWYYSSCSKSRCTETHYFRVYNEVEYIELTVNSDTYSQYIVGNTISFERHLVDPVILQQQRDDGKLWLKVLHLLCTIGFTFTGMWGLYRNLVEEI